MDAWMLAAAGALGVLLWTRLREKKSREDGARSRDSSTCTALVVHPKFKWQLAQKPVVERRVLPDDLTPLIMSFLDAKTLNKAAMVCKRWFFLSYSDKYWYRQCLAVYNVNPSALRDYSKKVVCARTLFIRLTESRARLLVHDRRRSSPSNLRIPRQAIPVS